MKQIISQSELDSLIGKAVDKALKKNNIKWEAIICKERDCFQKEREQFQTEKQLLDIKVLLIESSLPIDFAEGLSAIGDKEELTGTIQRIKSAWDKQMQNGISCSALKHWYADSNSCCRCLSEK